MRLFWLNTRSVLHSGHGLVMVSSDAPATFRMRPKYAILVVLQLGQGPLRTRGFCRSTCIVGVDEGYSRRQVVVRSHLACLLKCRHQNTRPGLCKCTYGAAGARPYLSKARRGEIQNGKDDEPEYQGTSRLWELDSLGYLEANKVVNGEEASQSYQRAWHIEESERQIVDIEVAYHLHVTQMAFNFSAC